MVKMWKNYFKGILNSENCANESAESVEHTTDCKEKYLGLQMLMCCFVLLTSLVRKLPLNRAPGPYCISAEYLLYADEFLRFLLSELFMCIVHGYAENLTTYGLRALMQSDVCIRTYSLSLQQHFTL